MTFKAPDADFNAMATAQAALITHIGLNESDPGTTGAGEAAGGSPAYARKAVTWGTAGAAGPLGSGTQPASVGRIYSNELTFDVDAATYSHWSGWSASSAGNYHGGDTLESPVGTPSPVVVGAQGQIKVWVYLDFDGS